MSRHWRDATAVRGAGGWKSKPEMPGISVCTRSPSSCEPRQERGRVHGTEYLARESPPAFSDMAFHNVVCYAPTRTAKITIPGRTSCPPSWTKEYCGYLMADRHVGNHASGRVPICVNANSESVPGNTARESGSFLYFIETTCDGIPCSAYP